MTASKSISGDSPACHGLNPGDSLTMQPARNDAGDVEAKVVSQVAAYCRACGQREAPARDTRSRWDVFFRDYHPYVQQVVLSSGVQRSDVEDCVQEVWIEIVRQLAAGRYDAKRGRFGGWIFTVARHKSVDFVRALRRNREVKFGDLDSLPSERELDPAISYERARGSEIVKLALKDLVRVMSAATFKSLYECSIEEKDCTAVASELGLTEKQVRYRRHRARQRLRTLLTQYGGGPDLLESR